MGREIVKRVVPLEAQSMGKHTPGPLVGKQGSIEAGDSHPESTARVLDSKGNQQALCLGRNAHGNAVLFAAAPDMLDALELVNRAHVGDGVDMATAVDACPLAIDKARGK